MGSPIKVSLVDDDAGLRRIWARKLKARPGFEVLGSFGDAESALAGLRSQPGDLAVVDWKLPGKDGVWLIQEIKAIHPELRTLLITAYNLDELPFAAFAAGADGFLLKPVPATAFPERLREVFEGKCPVSAEIARRLVERLRSSGATHRLSRLSPMEATVLELFGEGLDTKTVAARLDISPHTVVTHKRRAFSKLHAHNLASALHRLSHGDGRRV